MNLHAYPLLAVSLLLLLAACGSTVVTPGTGGTSGTGATTGTGASTVTTTLTGGGGGCPTSEPAAGASCAGLPAGLECTYGDSVRAECRSVWTCNAGTWTSPHTACSMSTACGTQQPTAGTTCPQNGVACTYGDTICICSQCPTGPCMGGGPTWSCAGPPTGANCPPVVPNAGTGCSMDGTMCTYGFPCGGSGQTVECSGGQWQWTLMACPG